MNKFSLDKHPKIASGFTTPERYFEHFPGVVLEKIKEDNPKKATVFTLKNFSYAAAAVLFIALSIPFLRSESKASFDQIDTASMESYIASQANASQYDLINMLDINDLDDMHVNLALEDQSIEDILTTNPNFENYITE